MFGDFMPRFVAAPETLEYTPGLLAAEQASGIGDTKADPAWLAMGRIDRDLTTVVRIMNGVFKEIPEHTGK